MSRDWLRRPLLPSPQISRRHLRPKGTNTSRLSGALRQRQKGALVTTITKYLRAEPARGKQRLRHPLTCAPLRSSRKSPGRTPPNRLFFSSICSLWNVRRNGGALVLQDCDKKCDNKPPLPARADFIDSSGKNEINNFCVCNTPRRIRLTRSPANPACFSVAYGVVLAIVTPL